MYVTRGGSRKTEWQSSCFWKKSGSLVIGMSPLRMISRCVCEGRWVCACVVSSRVHRTARNAESLLLLIVRCWTVSASQPDTTHRAPTQQLETPREGRRLTTAKRVCSLADPASSQPVQPAVRDPAAPEWLHDATAANWSPRSGNPSWRLEAEGLAVLQS